MGTCNSLQTTSNPAEGKPGPPSALQVRHDHPFSVWTVSEATRSNWCHLLIFKTLMLYKTTKNNMTNTHSLTCRFNSCYIWLYLFQVLLFYFYGIKRSFFLFMYLGHAACGILVPQLGNMSLALEV